MTGDKAFNEVFCQLETHTNATLKTHTKPLKLMQINSLFSVSSVIRYIYS